MFNSLHPPLLNLKSNYHLRLNLEETLSHKIRSLCLPPIISASTNGTSHLPTSSLSSSIFPGFQRLSLSSVHTSPNHQLHSKSRHCWTHDPNAKTESDSHAFTGNKIIFSHSHQNAASVFPAELQAIFQCLKNILTPISSSQIFFTFGCFQSSLRAPARFAYPHPLHTLLATSLAIVFRRTSDHMGIPRNEKVDERQNKPLALPVAILIISQPTPNSSYSLVDSLQPHGKLIGNYSSSI